MSTEKIIKSKSGWLFLLITIALLQLQLCFWLILYSALSLQTEILAWIHRSQASLVHWYSSLQECLFQWPVQPSAWSSKGLCAVW